MMQFRKLGDWMNEDCTDYKEDIIVHVDFQLGFVRIDEDVWYFSDLNIEHLYDDKTGWEDIIAKKLDLDDNYIFEEV